MLRREAEMLSCLAILSRLAVLLALGPSLAAARLTPRVFDGWLAYYAWRDAQTGRQDVIPCVAAEGGYACLPSLVVLGAYKGGTTGFRLKLLASEQFIGWRQEHLFWDRRVRETHRPREAIANVLSWFVSAERFDSDFVVFEENPRYMYDLDNAKHRFIRSVLPDATMVFLARAGADIEFSHLEMAADFDGCGPLEPFGTTCAAAIPEAVRAAHVTFREGDQGDVGGSPTGGDHRVRAADLEQRWEDVRVNMSHPLSVYVAFGGFYHSLKYLWRAWPREQTLVLESPRVWSHPRESYDALARQLRLDFTIRLVPNTRTRPPRQDHPKCRRSEGARFKRLVSDCGLKMPFRCVWYSANEKLAELLERRPVPKPTPFRALPSRHFNFGTGRIGRAAGTMA